MPLADDVDLDALAVRSDGMSGADLASMCQRAALNEIRALIAEDRKQGGNVRTTSSDALRIRMSTLEASLEEQRNSVAARGGASGSSPNGTTSPGRAPGAAPAARPV